MPLIVIFCLLSSFLACSMIYVCTFAWSFSLWMFMCFCFLEWQVGSTTSQTHGIRPLTPPKTVKVCKAPPWQSERGACCRIRPPKSGLARCVTFRQEADTMWLKRRSTISCATARHVLTHHALYTLQNKLLSSTKQQHLHSTRTDYLLSPATRPWRRATTTTTTWCPSCLRSFPFPTCSLGIAKAEHTENSNRKSQRSQCHPWACNCNIAHRNGALPRRSPPKTTIADRHARSATWPRNGNITHHTRVLPQSLLRFSLCISHLTPYCILYAIAMGLAIVTLSIIIIVNVKPPERLNRLSRSAIWLRIGHVKLIYKLHGTM